MSNKKRIYNRIIQKQENLNWTSFKNGTYDKSTIRLRVNGQFWYIHTKLN
jgi:hypothetical protein